MFYPSHWLTLFLFFCIRTAPTLPSLLAPLRPTLLTLPVLLLLPVLLVSACTLLSLTPRLLWSPLLRVTTPGLTSRFVLNQMLLYDWLIALTFLSQLSKIETLSSNVCLPMVFVHALLERLWVDDKFVFPIRALSTIEISTDQGVYLRAPQGRDSRPHLHLLPFGQVCYP